MAGDPLAEGGGGLADEIGSSLPPRLELWGSEIPFRGPVPQARC